MNYSLFISCAKGLEYLLENEVRSLGLDVSRVNPQGVFGEASISVLYQLCLWSRLANRVQLILFSGEACDEKSLYQLARDFEWSSLFTVDKTVAIEFHGTSATIRNSMYGAQVVKDAIVDYFRALHGDQRPTIDKDNANIRLHAHLKRDVLTVSYDLCGYSLHQRGYRQFTGEAPLKETLAAAMLIRANWPELAEQSYSLLDPFCGSGTVVIEAAMMAANRAPGLLRHDQSFQYWQANQPEIWQSLCEKARAAVKPLATKLVGTDINPQLIMHAYANAERADVLHIVQFAQGDISDAQASSPKGLLISNPPYGERLGDASQLVPLYQKLGRSAFEHFQGWQAAFLTSNPELAKATGLRSNKHYTLYNGPLECKLYCLSIDAANKLKTHSSRVSFSAGGEMLANRLLKNKHHLKKWIARENISCYRIYDADLPEYAFAIDVYNDHVVLQEYAAPSSIDASKVEKRRQEVLHVVPAVLGVAAENVILKSRKQQKGSNQYQKLASTHAGMVVTEGRAKLKINVHDYLDTGLFLDHRLLRLQFANLRPGSSFLNCFSYTASASVHAALAGAFTTNVDLSTTYLNWAEENFKLNRIDCSRHQFVQFDCLQWLQISRDTFDVIFLDPPSFSNSKRMDTTLDIQRDHVALIHAAMRLLNPDGCLYFSTNLRHFKIDQSLNDDYQVANITAATIDIDFKRNARIHHCFTIQKI